MKWLGLAIQMIVFALLKPGCLVMFVKPGCLVMFVIHSCRMGTFVVGGDRVFDGKAGGDSGVLIQVPKSYTVSLGSRYCSNVFEAIAVQIAADIGFFYLVSVYRPPSGFNTQHFNADFLF